MRTIKDFETQQDDNANDEGVAQGSLPDWDGGNEAADKADCLQR